LTPFSHESHKLLIDKDLKLEFCYRPNLECVAEIVAKDMDKPIQKEELAGEIFAEMNYIMETEIQRGRPRKGPQLDDFEVRLDGVDLRVFGSQGETRTATVALILARSDVLFKKRHIRPILFLDDIFSELDRHRTRRLQDMASRHHQVFVATARADDITGWKPAEMKVWNVQGGHFTEISGTALSADLTDPSRPGQSG
jgi:DNA replication and repair protein RecF